MKSLIVWIVISVTGVGAVLWLGPKYFENITTIRQVADASNLKQVELGKAVYSQNCASCHGDNLEGQPNWRSQLPSGGLPAPPHDETGHTWHHSDQLNFKYTKFGGQSIAPKGFKSNMPGFKSQLSDEEIWASLAFIKSSWPLKIRRRHAKVNSTQ
jgi:mono/diheme cytochrome c family protein